MKDQSPPKLSLRFFRWYCHPDYLEDLEGDLIERFEKRAEDSDLKYAKWGFTKDVIRLCRPGIIKPLIEERKSNSTDMFRNHFTLTLRSLIKNKGFTTINMAGLTLAFVVCLFSLQYVDFELSYDDYHEQKNQIYRLVTDVKTTSGTKLESSSIPVAPEAAQQFPEIQNYTRVFLDYLLVQSSADNYQEEDIAYAEESIFEVFSFPMIKGNPKKVFDTPFNAVISESAALKYFGTTDCIGKELTLDGKTPAFISGVMEDMPENSHFRVDIFLSLSSLTEVWNPNRKTNWTAFGCYSYLLLDPNADVNALNDKISLLVNEKIQTGEAEYHINLEPLTDVYLYADPRGSRTGSSLSGNIQNVYIFSIIAALVLFIAVFNFINISNSLYLKRAKEMSMKKILGVSGIQQKTHYLLDAILFSVVCSLISIALFIFFAPSINELAAKPIVGNALDHMRLYSLIMGLAILVGFLSGIFPAFILSNFKYDHLLKGNVNLSSKGVLIKNGMVIIQFTISIIMIISAVVVTKQLNFIQNKDLGYSKSQKLIIDFHFDGKVNKNEVVIKQNLNQLSGIESVSISSSIPGMAGRKSMTELPTKDGQVIEMYSQAFYVDYDFLDQYKIELIAGRGFEKERLSDYRETMILNESAVKELGYDNPEEILGRSFLQGGRWRGEVIGVVKDFHYNSLREKIAPLTISIARGYFTFLTLEMNTDNVQNTTAQVEDTWKEVLPELPLSYSFADQTYERLYQSEQQFGKLTFYFAVIAISLSLIGLLGLATLSANDRLKEMSIRKVLGASPFQLMVLLSKGLLSLVLLGFAIGIPISIYASTNWLANFAYRYELNWFLIAPFILAILALTLLTIGSQVYKTAIMKPTESLKNE